MEPVLCCQCNKPSAYLDMVDNRLVRVTGTFRVYGEYKNEKGKTVGKEYAHYPDCQTLKLRSFQVVL